MGAIADYIDALTKLPEGERAKTLEQARVVTRQERWLPNPGPQTDAYFSNADEIFYGGQAGGGKSDLGVGLALNEHHRSLILRRFNDDARALAERALDIVGSRAGFNGQELRLRVDGRQLDFGGCKDEADKQRYKGDPHDLIVLDEAPDFLESQALFIFAWNRTTKKDQRCRVLLTGNPPTTPEGMWIVRRYAAWLDPTHPRPAKPGDLRWYTTGESGDEIEVDGAGPHEIGGESVLAKSRTFIRARLDDNPDLAATDYDATLAALPGELRDAYREGKFDAGLRDQPMQAIPTAWIRAAQDRWDAKCPDGIPMCAIGVDMSGGSHDPMIIAPRHDGWFSELIEIPANEIPAKRPGKYAAGLVVSYRRDNAIVVVDMGGGHGGGIYEQLHDNSIEAVAHKGMDASVRRTEDGQLGFTNKRSEVIWKFREALDPSQPGGAPISLPPDQTLLADLSAPTFKPVGGKIQVEAKADVVKRLGRSTDRGDAVVMAWSAGPTYITDGDAWRAQAAERAASRGHGRRPQVQMGRQNRRSS